MKAVWMFAVVGALLIAVLGAVLALVFSGAGERRAVVLSAAVAMGTQVITFAILRLSAKENVMAGWGLGAILRFLVLGVWALVFVKSLGLPSVAATVSLALFLFASTLVEPLFLKT